MCQTGQSNSRRFGSQFDVSDNDEDNDDERCLRWTGLGALDLDQFDDDDGDEWCVLDRTGSPGCGSV